MSTLADILQGVDRVKTTVGRNVSDLLSNPADYLSMTAANIPNTVREYGEDPMNFVGGGKAAGILVPRRYAKGLPLNEEMTPIHKTTARGLNSALEDPEGLFAPSYAITKGETLGGKFGPITLALRGEAVDPANKTGILFNRDAYTSRISPEKTAETLRNLRTNAGGVRNARGNPELEFYESHGGRFGEGSDPSGGIPHGLAIDQSPSFRSHADYLSSPQGAALLDPTYQRVNTWAQQQRTVDDFQRALRNAGFDPDVLENIFAQGGPGANELIKQAARSDARQLAKPDIPALRALAEKSGAWVWDLAGLTSDYATPHLLDLVRNAARKLVKQSRTAPSQYAEGKVLDRVPLDQRSVRAAIMPRNTFSQSTSYEMRSLMDQLRERSIPIVEPRDYAHEFPGMDPNSLSLTNAVLRRISSKD